MISLWDNLPLLTNSNYDFWEYIPSPLLSHHPYLLQDFMNVNNFSQLLPSRLNSYDMDKTISDSSTSMPLYTVFPTTFHCYCFFYKSMDDAFIQMPGTKSESDLILLFWLLFVFSFLIFLHTNTSSLYLSSSHSFWNYNIITVFLPFFSPSKSFLTLFLTPFQIQWNSMAFFFIGRYFCINVYAYT